MRSWTNTDVEITEKRVLIHKALLPFNEVIHRLISPPYIQLSRFIEQSHCMKISLRVIFLYTWLGEKLVP